MWRLKPGAGLRDQRVAGGRIARWDKARLLGRRQDQESAFHDVSNDPGPHDTGPSRRQAVFEGYDLSRGEVVRIVPRA